MNLKALVGSGDNIALFAFPFLMLGLVLNIAFPAAFRVGGPPAALAAVSAAVLAVGVVAWAWSAVLIARRVPKRELITDGPFSLVKHPLYTGVALLVLPWLGFLCDTWLGAALGVVLYAASRIFEPAEEAALARTFGAAWTRYSRTVRIRWL